VFIDVRSWVSSCLIASSSSFFVIVAWVKLFTFGLLPLACVSNSACVRGFKHVIVVFLPSYRHSKAKRYDSQRCFEKECHCVSDSTHFLQGRGIPTPYIQLELSHILVEHRGEKRTNTKSPHYVILGNPRSWQLILTDGRRYPKYLLSEIRS
jgi:hypothetical protein